MKILKAVCCAATIGLFVGASYGQVPSVFSTGFNTPNKVILGQGNTLLVAEAGIRASNTGRVSLVNRRTGARSDLITGLPSAVNFLGGPAGDPDGPSGLLLIGNKLYIVIGVGDAVVPGTAPGLETPNPALSSPIFDSVLEVTLPRAGAHPPGPFSMTLADQATLAGGGSVTLTDSAGRQAVVRVAIDLPDYIAAPRPNAPHNVKASHLYGIARNHGSVYLADAGLNRIVSVDLTARTSTVLSPFANRPNPLFPMLGGPEIEAVPSNLKQFGGRLFAPLLTGFPFVQGLSEISSVDPATGASAQFIGMLSSAIDIESAGDDDDAAGSDAVPGPHPDRHSADLTNTHNTSPHTMHAAQFDTHAAPHSPHPVEHGADEANLTANHHERFYTLEFSTNLLAGAPARLRFYDSPSAAPVDLLTNLPPSTSMVVDNRTGSIFIANIAAGTLTKVVFP